MALSFYLKYFLLEGKGGGKCAGMKKTRVCFEVQTVLAVVLTYNGGADSMRKYLEVVRRKKKR